MAQATAITPQELAQQERQNQQEQERSRVHPLDPDFILFAFPLALLVDAIDIVLELTSFLVVPKVIGLLLDFGTLIILGAWMYWRIGKLAKTKRRQQQDMRRSIRQGRTAVRGPLRKVLLRLGLASIVEIIPLIGILFAWTVMVISTLREK